MTPMQQYHQQLQQRADVISENRARRMRRGNKLPPLPVPPKPDRPLVPIAYDSEGGYIGRLPTVDDAEPGWIVRMEPAAY
jgi:hypothetical protein